MKLEVSTMTDPGRQRGYNEDNVWAQIYTNSEGDAIGLFIVCDGMGGHLGGKYASYWAIEAVKQELANLFCPGDPRATLLLPRKEVDAALEEISITRESASKEIEDLIVNAVEKANLVVYEYAQQNPEKAADAGTTLTMAVVHGNQAIFANVGDSRTYILRKKKLRQITREHSLVACLDASGQLEPEEVFTHPQRNMIFRSLGQKRKLQIDIFKETLQAGDQLLFCSDGLWEMVQDESIMANLILESDAIDQACTKLVDAANTAGGEDNIGIVLAKIS